MQNIDWEIESFNEEKKHKIVINEDDEENIVIKDNNKKISVNTIEKKTEKTNFENTKKNIEKKEIEDDWDWGNDEEKVNNFESKEKNKEKKTEKEDFDNDWEDWEEKKETNNNNKNKYVGISSNSPKNNLTQNDLNKLKKAKLNNTAFMDMTNEEKAEYLKDVSFDSYNVVSQKTVEYGGVVYEKVSDLTGNATVI
jgi:hypothetical protein